VVLQIADLHSQLDRLAEAENEFKRTLELNTSSSGAYNGLGNVYYSQRKYPDAVFLGARHGELDVLCLLHSESASQLLAGNPPLRTLTRTRPLNQLEKLPVSA